MSVPDGGQNPPQDPQSQDPQAQGLQSQEPQRPAQDAPAPQPGGTEQATGSPALPPQAPQFGDQAPQGSPTIHGAPAPDGAPASQGAPAAPQGAAAPGGAAATGMTPQELQQKLTSVGLVNPLPSLAVGAATYIGGIVLSILTIVLIVIAAAFASIGNPVEAALETADMAPGEALSGIGSALRFPFQLVAMAMLGSLGFSKTVEGETISASVRLLPGLITIAMVLLSFYGGRFVQKRQGAGQIGIWVSSVLTGFGVALVTVLAALILAQPVPVYGDISLRLHAAGFDAFFGAFFLITLALALGRVSVRPRPAWWPLLTDLTSGVKLALAHALIVTVLGVVGITVFSTISALIDGEKPPMLFVILLLPLVGGYLLSYLTGAEMLSAVTASVNGPGILGMFGGGFGNETATIFSMPWYVWLCALLIGGIGLVLASLLWQHQRRVVPDNVIALGISWIALPVAYFVGSLGLLILARASVKVGYSGSFGDGEQMSAAVGLAAWTPLLALMAGVTVELLSRFAAPLAAPFIPGAVLSWFRRPLTPAAAGAPTAPGTTEGAGTAALSHATVPLGVTGGALAVAGAADPSTGQPAAAPSPLSPTARKLLIGGSIAVGGAFVLVVGLVIAFNVISGTVYSPDKKVEAYLSALQDGEASTAVELSAPNAPTAQQALLTDAIAGAAEDRISGFEIVDSEEVGEDRREITAEITQDGVTTTRSFLVERSGRTALVFPEWQLQETSYAFLAIEIPDGATSLLVNDQEVPVDALDPQDGMATAAVLPGDYTVSLPEVSEMIAPEASAVHVTMDPDDWYELHAAPQYMLSEAGVAEAQKQVDAKVDECATSTEADPEGCPFGAYAWGIVEGSGSWTIDAYPTVALEPSRDGWRLTSFDSPGEATFDFQTQSWDDEIEDESDTREFSVEGTVTLAEDGTLVVEFQDNYW